MNRTSNYWKIYYRYTTATIKLQKKNSKIPMRKGVRQGDTISTKLFTACFEEIFKKMEWDDMGLKIDGEYLNNEGEHLKKIINDLHKENLKEGLKINMKKTMYSNQLVRRQVVIRNEALQLVEEYTYLGQKISANPAHEKEIRRIGMGWSAFRKLIIL